jgi:hypothetical protein
MLIKHTEFRTVVLLMLEFNRIRVQTRDNKSSNNQVPSWQLGIYTVLLGIGIQYASHRESDK